MISFSRVKIFVGFVGRRDVGLADDFNQRNAGAVEVDGGLFVGVGKAFVQALASVFFQMHAGDANLLSSQFSVLSSQFLSAAPVFDAGTSMKPNSASGLSYCEIW